MGLAKNKLLNCHGTRARIILAATFAGIPTDRLYRDWKKQDFDGMQLWIREIYRRERITRTRARRYLRRLYRMGALAGYGPKVRRLKFLAG